MDEGPPSPAFSNQAPTWSLAPNRPPRQGWITRFRSQLDLFSRALPCAPPCLRRPSTFDLGLWILRIPLSPRSDFQDRYSCADDCHITDAPFETCHSSANYSSTCLGQPQFLQLYHPARPRVFIILKAVKWMITIAVWFRLSQAFQP